MLHDVLNDICASKLSLKILLVDNSPTNELNSLQDLDSRIEYIKADHNLGFGRAHNIALRSSLTNSQYHLILNPDIRLGPDTLEKLIALLDSDTSVGLALPKVLNFKSELQFLCKRLPAPFDLLLRRLKLTWLFKRRANYYEMRDKDYNASFEAPILSGCFMFLRVDALKKIGLFDERYFMYLEDFDLSRRIHKHFKTLYFPEAQIYHAHARQSYGLNKLLLIHLRSAIQYFTKWGWFYDKERNAVNKQTALK